MPIPTRFRGKKIPHIRISLSEASASAAFSALVRANLKGDSEGKGEGKDGEVSDF